MFSLYCGISTRSFPYCACICVVVRQFNAFNEKLPAFSNHSFHTFKKYQISHFCDHHPHHCNHSLLTTNIPPDGDIKSTHHTVCTCSHSYSISVELPNRIQLKVNSFRLIVKMSINLKLVFVTISLVTYVELTFSAATHSKF